MKIMIKIALHWWNMIAKRSFMQLVIIFMVVIFLVVLPIVGSVLPFTYLAL